MQYRGKPDYFASELARLAAEGVRILGGCCGTTPAHIAALRKALDALPEGLPCPVLPIRLWLTYPWEAGPEPDAP